MSQSSNKVFEYLSDLGGNNFTENAPRPPVPGEENEQQSTHSSGSHKSHMSMKSHSSGKSGGSQNGEVSQSATPRRSNLDKTCTGGSLSCSVQGLDKCDDENAPLGFEPEGSAANSPPFTETSTPPCLKWASGLHHLLDDSDGVQLFSKFLEHEGGGKNPLDFFFACQGLKKQLPSETVKINHIIKVIHKKFIRGDSLSCISARSRKAISDQLDSKRLRQSIFNEAQSEVEEFMKKTPYRLFLNSDFYVQYVERAGKSSETSSGSNSVRPLSGPLPTLMEDQEMPSQSFEASSLMGPPSSRYTSFTQSESKGARRTETIAGYVPYTIRQSPSHPYYTSYAPVSAVDSEIQSLSSDALTDDTVSLTDSSVDGYRDGYRDGYPAKKWKHQRRAVHRRAQQNREGKDAAPFIPRTDRPPKDRNIAETDPPKFAALLIEKLEVIQKEKEKEEKMEESLRMCESEDGEKNETTMKPSNSALLLMQSIEEDNPQSILEDHCSRIWDNSSHHTPSRSPGRHSPKSKSPDRTLRKLPASGANTTFPGTLISKSQRKSKKDNNYVSMLSFDSGVGEDREKHVVHHHHHHHHSDLGRAGMEWAAQSRSMSCWRSDGTQGMKGSTGGSGMAGPGGDEARRKDSGRRSNGRKMSTDASSVFDSGISGVYEKEPSLPAPNPTDPNYEKVLHWMLASDSSMSAPSGTTNPADSDRTASSSGKWSHKVASSSPSPQPHKTGCSKKQPSLSTSNRSASAERGGATPARLPHGGVLPGQPFVQDPSMPILTPPNITTQLEEAKRRLESEAQQKASSVPVKSKSFTGVPSREKRMLPPSQSSSQVRSNTLSSTRTVPSGLDLQSANMTLPSLSSSEKKSCKKLSTPVAANTSAMASLPSQSHSQPASMSQSMEETVIGIYFCGDPIPYRHTISGTNITLGQFKQLITKRGNYRYYFKKNSDEFGSGAVFEEVAEEGLILPLWEGKIVAKVERLD